jgi:PAS domain S-box-containing protein
VKHKKISTFLLTFLTSSSAILISFIVLSVTFLLATNHYFVEKQTDSLFTSAKGIIGVVEYGPDGDSISVNERLIDFLSLISGFTGNNVIVTDDTGLVIATSDEKQPTGLYVGSKEVGAVIFNGAYSEIGDLGGLYAYEHFSAGVPIVSPSGTISGTVFVSYPSTNFRATIFKLERLFVLTALIVLIFSTLLIYVSMQRMSRPLISMSAAVREFARGNFKIRVPYDGSNSEVSQLASSFNHMASELERTEELRSSELKYRTIFENTGAATIMIEKDMHISLANSQFVAMSGYRLREIINAKSWLDFIDEKSQRKLIGDESPSAAADRFGCRFVDRFGSSRDILVTLASVPETTSRVASLTDITELKEAERQIYFQAFHDTLTHLPNRALFIEHLTMALKRAKRRPDYRFAVIYLDIDRFKLVNDNKRATI